MNKILLIIKREYITRVRNKTFLLSTFLLPILFILLIAGSIFFARGGGKKSSIAVMDTTGFFKSILKNDSSKLVFSFEGGVDTSNYSAKGFDGLLYAADTSGRYLVLATKKTASLEVQERIESFLNTGYQNSQLLKNGISKVVLDSIRKASKDFYTVENKTGGDKVQNARGNTAIGTICGMLIYITMFIFGAMVMRGVMEEKTNRIAEVMVSSVKPFQLMMGKILGIGAVGLTQLFLWIILMVGISFAASAFLSPGVMAEVQQIQNNPSMISNSGSQLSDQAIAISKFKNFNWPLILSSFVFYFFGGYLFYSSLFAAVGSVINEDPQEAQSLMLPIMMPIIFGFIIVSTNAGNPDSPAMFWGSMIPFTSPVVMMGRIAADPPAWQIILSIILLILGFIFTTWLAGRIYRTGILLYGKKASWKEMLKWAFRKS